MAVNKGPTAHWIGKKTFQNVPFSKRLSKTGQTFDLNGPKLNVLIRVNISNWVFLTCTQQILFVGAVSLIPSRMDAATDLVHGYRGLYRLFNQGRKLGHRNCVQGGTTGHI